MDGTIGRGAIRIDADVSSAINQLSRVSKQLNSLVPGGNTVSAVFQRIHFGLLQIVQGAARNTFINIQSGLSGIVKAGVKVAETLEQSAVGFDTLLESGEDVNQLLLSIQENAVKTPFDVDALTLSTQKLALITKNGGQAEKAVLSLGKALAAAGRGTTELNRMATNLQQIGTNAYVSARDLREFGNAGINIVDLVYEYSDAFKATGKSVNEVKDWLQSIGNPYEVIVEALNKAGDDVNKFGEIYEKGSQTIKQANENMQDSIGIFSYRVLEQSKILDKTKNIWKEFQEGLFLDKTFTANTIAAIERLLKLVNEMDIIKPIIEGIKKAMSAFASGQFDNVIVFFKNLFNAIKQFSGIKVITNAFKVLLDLFSDNHTAEEVARVATQIGNLVRVFLELKMMGSVANYFGNLTTSILSMGQGLVTVLTHIPSLVGGLGGLSKTTLLVVGAFAALVTVVSVFANVTGEGMQGIITNVTEAFKGLVEILGKAVKNMVTFGKNLMIGLYNGIVEGFNTVITKVKEVAGKITDAFKNAFGIHSPSTVMRDEIGRYIDEGIAEGIRIYYGSVIRAAEKVLDRLVDMQDTYVKELSEFGAIDLVQQVNIYRQFATLYEKGTKARLEMDEKVHNAEVSIVKEMITLIEQYNKEFNKSYDSAKNYYGVMDYIQPTLTRKASSVIEGLKRDVANMQKYYENLVKMSTMGYSAEFMEYIRSLGMEAASEVAGLANATADEVQQINDLWAQKSELATKIAVENTRELKTETLKELGYLQSGLKTKVVNYYDTGTLLTYNFANGIYDAFPKLEDAVAWVTANTKSAADETKQAVQATTDSLNDDAVEDFTKSLEHLDLKLYDTKDIFSLFKNLLKDIPWWVWAGTGIAVLGKVSTAGIKFFKTFKGGGATLLKDTTSLGRDVKTVIEETFDINDVTKNLSRTVKATEKGISDSVSATQQEVQGAYKKTTKTVSKAAKQVNDTTYSSATKVGKDLLHPFKVFNTKVQAVGNSISNFINTFVNVIFSVIDNFLKQIMNLVNTVFGGIGKAIKSLLKPLSDPQLLIGVGVLGALAGVIFLLAQAGEAFDRVSWEGMANLAVAAVGLLAVTAAMAALSVISGAIMAGAVAVAAAGVALGLAATAMGAGLLVITTALEKAGEVGAQIQTDGLLAVIGAVALVSSLLTLLTPFEVFGALAGIAAAVLSVEFLVIAGSLTLASLAGQNIVMEGIQQVMGALAAVSVGLSFLTLFSVVGAIAGIAASVLSVEFLIIAAALTAGSAIGSNVVPEGIDKVMDAIAKVSTGLTVLGIVAALGAIAGIAATILSVEMLIIAASLLGASVIGNKIDTGGLDKLIDSVARVSEGMTALTFFTIIATVASTAATIMSVEMLIIAMSLWGASEIGNNIDIGGLDKMITAVAHVSEGMTGLLFFTVIGAAAGAAASILSVEMLIIAASLAKASELGQDIVIDNLDAVIASVDHISKGMTGLIFFTTIGAAAGAAASILSIEMLIIAASLAEASSLGRMVDIDSLQTLIQAVEVVSVGITALAFFETIGAIAGLAASILSVEFQTIAQSLATASVDARLIDLDALALIGKAIEVMNSIDFGGFFENLGKAVVSEMVKAIAGNIDAIISFIADAMHKLQQIDAIQESDVERYMDKVRFCIETLAEMSYGDFIQNLKNADSSEKLKIISENIGHIITFVAEAVRTLQALDNEVGGESAVRNHVENARHIVEEIAKLTLEDQKDGPFSKSTMEKTKEAAERLVGITGSMDSIIASTKEIVQNLASLSKQGVTDTQVRKYVEDAKNIMNQFAEVQPSEEVSEETKNNVERIANVASNIDTILKSAKSIVEQIKYFHDNIGGATKAAEYVAEANAIVAEFGKLALPNETEGAYETLAKNSSDLATAVKSVAEILDNGKKMFELVKAYDDYTQGMDVELMVQHINKMLAVIAGGDAYSDGQTTWHKGISMPEGTHFSENDVSALENVKKAIDSVKTIAEAIQTVPDVADKLGGVEKIVEFISETMSKLPEAVTPYATELGEIGKQYATNFINGWEGKLPDMETAAWEMQDALWRVLDSKMNDEYHQGEALARSVVDGILSIKGDMAESAHTLQDAFWTKLQSYIGSGNDEYLQGQWFAKSIVEGIKSIKDEFAESAHVLQDAFWTKLQSYIGTGNDEYRQGEAFGRSIKEGIESVKGEFAEVAHTLQDAFWQKMQTYIGNNNDGYSQGIAFALSIRDGIVSTKDTFAESAHTLQDAFWQKLQSYIGDWKDEYNQGRDLTQSVINGANSVDASGAGQNVAIGFANGIWNNTWRINNAAGALSETAINKMREVLGIHSPSRVAAEMGGNYATGFAEGIEDSLSEVETAGEMLAEAVMDGYSDTIQPINTTALEARSLVNDNLAGRNGTYSRTTNVTQNNNIYNGLDMAGALSDLQWAISRS